MCKIRLQISKSLALVVILVALVINALSGIASQETIQQANPDIQAQKLFELLQAISPFIKTDKGGKQELLENEARRAEVSAEAVELGRKVVAATNRLYEASVNNETIEAEELEFSFIEPLFKAIARSKGLGIAGTRVKDVEVSGMISLAWYQCMGLTSYPDPCPPRYPTGLYFSSETAVRDFLLRMGFHKTAGYACNNNPYDYSVVVSHLTCGWGTFRNQATLRKDLNWWTFELQGPEPNPEIFSYPWPIPWWGYYVQWWHRYYC